MVICGSDPNLQHELSRSNDCPGFPDPDLFDRYAHVGRRLLTPLSPTSDSLPLHEGHAAASVGSR